VGYLGIIPITTEERNMNNEEFAKYLKEQSIALDYSLVENGGDGLSDNEIINVANLLNEAAKRIIRAE
jgi:hypothetical protein